MKSNKKVVQGSNALGAKGLNNNNAILQAQITALRANGGKGGGSQQRNSQTMTQVQALQVNQTLVNQKHSAAVSPNNTNMTISSPRQQQNQSMNINTVGGLEVSKRVQGRGEQWVRS